LHVALESTAPHLIKEIRLGAAERPIDQGRRDGISKAPVLTWENVRDRLKAEEAAGFSGSVLLVRDGEILLHEGYGLADREKKIANRPETVFAIGSTPIDFTKAAILKLQDMGKLQLSDTITKFLPNVPEDKKSITIGHLMTGRSGLQNFHGRPGDEDPDNAWIDRETAVRRILEDELLFAPGTDRAHSHSAFGLLAAVVEIVSGEPVGSFFEKYLFQPAGMTKTTLYENIRAPTMDVAVGYRNGEVGPGESPTKWGKTSWLVMGSGGMVSTTGDLYRFQQALRDGKLLSENAQRQYGSQGQSLLVGGNMHGFYTAYTEGPGSLMFVCSNEIGRDRTKELTQELANFVNRPKFRVGLSLQPDPAGILIESVEPGTPADRAGLRGGDRITTINGLSLQGEDAPMRFREQVSQGRPIELRILRGQTELTVTVVPDPA
jgi:CubicO group peptidase (beta-lactamase class C family)